jgi:CHAT domain-containing protein
MVGWKSNAARATATIALCSLLLSTLAGAGASRAQQEDPVAHGNELLTRSEVENRSNHPLALATARDALTLFQSANNQPGIAAAYFQIGICHHAMRDLTDAIENYQLARQKWVELNDTNNQAKALIHLAFVEQIKGNWPSASAYYDQAKVLEQNDPIQLGQISNALGYFFNQYGMPETALLQYQQSLAYYQQANHELWAKRTAMDIAVTNLLLNNYDAALTGLRQLLPGFVSGSVDAAQCHENLGRVYLAKHEYPAALEHLELALSIYENTDNPGEIAIVRMWIAQVYEQQGKLPLARSGYLEARTVFQRLQDRRNEAETSFRLGRIELKDNHLDAAETYLKDSIDTTEELRSVAVGRELTTAYSASVHDRYQAYITCLLRKSKSASTPGLSAQAFEASELSRGRSLIELLRDTQTNLLAGVDPQLAEREQALRLKIRANSDRRLRLLGAKDSKQEDIKEVETTLNNLRAEHQQLSEQLRKSNPAYGNITQPTAYTLQKIQNEVIDDDQTALVEYILGEESSYVWVVTRNNIRVTELPSEGVITKAVQNAYSLLSVRPKAGDDSALSKALDEVAALVVNPIADQLPAQRIILVADGALNYIPFQVLPSPSDKQPLIATREIVNAPSASILGQLRQEKLSRTSPENVVAAFGYPAFVSNYAELKNTSAGDLMAEVRTDNSGSWSYAMRDIEVGANEENLATVQPLIHTREELVNLREVAGPASFFATGFNASRETLEHTDLSKYGILHFATHGVLDPNRPEKSGILLSTVGPDGRKEEGFITVQDVYQLRAPVSLVVLSACRTGLGKDVRGEGLISLTRGFMYAGASSIAASLWNVNDDATAELMKQFYINMLKEGATPAAALRAAQNRIRQQPQWRSPHYWAAFTFQGEYQQPAKLPAKTVFTARRIIVALLVLFVVGSLGWWYLRRRRTQVKTRRGYSMRKT